MNVLPALLQRSVSRTERSLRGFLGALLIFAFAGAGVFTATNAYAAGTIQIAGSVAPNNNNPHQGCTIYVEFFGYAVGSHDVEVDFVAKKPKNPLQPLVTSFPASGPLNATTFNGTGGGLNEALIYELDISSMDPTGNSGKYDVDVNVYTDANVAAHGAPSDQKTISVEGCNDDLAIDKQGPSTGTAPGTGSYTLSVSNVGPDRAPGPITVTDDIPAGETATAATGTGWVCTGPAGAALPLVGPGTLTCTRAADIGPGGAAGVSAPDIIVSVTYTATGVLRDTAVVSGSRSDLYAANNTDYVDTTVTAAPAPDVRVAKSVDKATAVTNEPGTYVLTAYNTGNASATSQITLIDTVPAGVTIGTIDVTSGFTCATVAQVITCHTDTDLAPVTSAASTMTVTVHVTFATTGLKSNSVDVSSTGDSDTTNNNATADTTVTAAPVPDVRVAKSVDKSAAVTQESGTYVLKVYNTGTGSQTSQITLVDTVPAGVTIGTIDETSGFTCATVAQVITCHTDTDLAPVTLAATTMTVTVHVTFATTGLKTNSVDVSSTGDSDTDNNNATADTTVTAPPVDPTAEVTKSNDANGDGEFHEAEVASAVTHAVTFKLSIKNTSPYAINVGQSIDDLVWLGDTPTQETAPTAFTCLPAITNLAPNATAACTFSAPSYAPPTGLTKYDQATVTLTKYVAPVVINNSLRRANLVVAAVAPFTATSNVSRVNTTLPATAVAPSVTASQCVGGVATAPSYTVPVTVGVVYSPAVGGVGVAGGTTTVTATAAPGFVLTNPGASPFTVTFGPSAANCSPPPPPPPAPSPSATPAPDNNIGVSKTGPGSAQPGDEIVYTIDVTNVKGTPATAFTVTDVLPAGLSYSSASGTDFTCANAGQGITCVYSGTLAVGAKASIFVRALLDSAFTGKTIANTAIVDPGRADTDAADNSSTATTDIEAIPFTGGGGGAAEQPTPAPSVEPTGGGGGGEVGLPFTGSNSMQILRVGVSLLLVGLFLMLTMRRRRSASE